MIMIMKSVWIALVGLLMLSVCMLSYASTALASNSVKSQHIHERIVTIPKNPYSIREHKSCKSTDNPNLINSPSELPVTTDSGELPGVAKAS